MQPRIRFILLLLAYGLGFAGLGVLGSIDSTMSVWCGALLGGVFGVVMGLGFYQSW
jgi:hypothetical protein